MSHGRLAGMSIVAVALGLLAIASALTLWNLKTIRETLRLRRLIPLRTQTLGRMIQDVSPGQIDEMRSCYKHPESVNLFDINWTLSCRPTPFVGYAPEPGQWAGVTINAQQMRDARPVTMPKPQGVYRIFLTGGSLAYGVGAPDEHSTIPAFLEAHLNGRALWPGRRVEVFNAAVPGWASTQERIRIENQICELAPDLVVDLTGVNDGHWGFMGRNTMNFRSYEDEFYLEMINSSMERALHEPYAVTFPPLQPTPVEAGLVAGRFARNIGLAAQALKGAGAQYVVALQPFLNVRFKKVISPQESHWLANHEPDGRAGYLLACYDGFERGLAGLQAPDNLHTVNILDVFAGREDPLFIDVYHTADKGNDLIAERLADGLAELVQAEKLP